MTYPKVVHRRRPAPVCPSSPRFPEIEERILRYWDEDGTFQRVGRANRDAGEDGDERVRLLRRPALRQRPAALRPPAHRLRQGHRPALPDDARAARRAPLRLGHPRPARRARGDAPARPQDQGGDPRARHRGVQRQVPRVGAEVHRGVARVRHPPGALGRLRPRLQDARTRRTWSRSSGRSSSCYDKGLVYEGFRVLPYCWNDQTPLSNHELRMDDDVYKMRQDPAVTLGFRLETGELALVWTTTPWTLPSNLAMVVGPDIDYVVVESDVHGHDRALRPRRGPPRRVHARARARTLRSASSSGSRAPTCVGRRYTPPFSLLPGPRQARTASSPADFVTTEDGTGLVHTAGAFGEEDKSVTDRRHRAGRAGRHRTAASPTRSSTTRACTSSTPTCTIIDHLKAATRGEGDHGAVTAGHRAAAPRDLRPLLPALLALPRAPDLHGGLVVVRRGDASSRTGCSSSTSRSRWVPEHVKDGQFGKWLENARDWSITRNRFWGSPIPGLEVRRPGATRASTSTARSRSSSATSASRSPTCTGRSSTS